MRLCDSVQVDFCTNIHNYITMFVTTDIKHTIISVFWQTISREQSVNIIQKM